jgi:flagellar protein FliL
MTQPRPAVGGDTPPASPPPTRRKGKLLLLAGLPLVLGAAGAGAWFFVPQVRTTVAALHRPSDPKPATPASKPIFVDLPEMTVTLPNGGRQRQMRIKLSLELAKQDPDTPPAQVLSPRVYDALLTYLRTLHDDELEGSLALDRLRSDLYRRLDLVLGSGMLRDVLITGLVVG